MNKQFNIDESLIGERLDKVLTHLDNSLTRNGASVLIDQGYILVNGKESKPSYKVKLEDSIVFLEHENESMDVKPENIPLNIIYEDDDLLVINKPQGMVVHPANGHYSGTVVNAVLYHCHNLSGINGVNRPGIVHRIDKDTSGLLVICKNDFSHNAISQQLQDHSMHREYYALVKGVIKEDDAKVIAPIGRDPSDRLKMAVDTKNGKDAITYVHVEQRFNQYTFISCKLETGRTHQIRVHLNYMGYPIEGDPVYGTRKNLLYNDGQLLHAYRLTLIHPRTNKEMVFEASLPDYFLEVLKNLTLK